MLDVLFDGYGFFSLGIKRTGHEADLHLVLRLKMSIDVFLLLLFVSIAWKGANLLFFRFLWPCVLSKSVKREEKTNKMQQSDVFDQLLSQHVSGIIMPIFRRTKTVCYCIRCTALVLLDVVGSGCGALRCRMRALPNPYSLAKFKTQRKKSSLAGSLVSRGITIFVIRILLVV